MLLLIPVVLCVCLNTLASTLTVFFILSNECPQHWLQQKANAVQTATTYVRLLQLLDCLSVIYDVICFHGYNDDGIDGKDTFCNRKHLCMQALITDIGSHLESKNFI